MDSFENIIAKRVFLAYSYRQYVSKTNKMIVIFNYYFYPVLFVINNGDDTFTFIKTISDKKSVDKFDDLLVFNNDFQKYLRDMFSKYPLTLRNYRIAISNYITDDGIIDQNENLLIDKSSKKIYNLQQIKQILIDEYDVSLNEFNQITDSTKEVNYQFNIDNVHFISFKEIDEEKIKSIFEKIKNMLSNTNLSSLLYGTVEIKDEFQDNTAGDYSNDIIRVGGDELQFIITFIHELGHRWADKIMTANQKKEFKKLFDSCNGKHIKLNRGDVITLFGNNTEYIYYTTGLSSLMLKGLEDDKMHYFNLNAIRSIDTINGKTADKYRFPSSYSRKKFSEFIAECIAYAYFDKMNDKKLQEKVKEIIG